MDFFVSIHKISDVYSFSNLEKKILTSSNSNGQITYWDEQYNLLWDKLYNKKQDVAIFKHYLYTKNIYGGKAFFIKKSDYSQIEIALDDFSLHTYQRISNEKIIASYRSVEGKIIRGLFDLTTLNFDWISDKGHLAGLPFLNNGYMFSVKNDLLTSFDTIGPLWHYTLPEKTFDWYSYIFVDPKPVEAEIRRLVGVYAGVLWIVLNSGRLLGLDVETGALMYNISQPNQYPDAKALKPEDGELYYGLFLQLDEANGVLFGLRDHYYYEIDLKRPTETYVIYDIGESCKQWQIEADMSNTHEWSWEGEEIYFGQNFSNANNLAVFNRTTRTITWATRLQKPNGGAHSFNTVAYAEGRLYVLDQTRTLHIFEKEGA